MKLMTMGDGSVFDNKTSFQAKAMAAATATKMSHKSLKISKNERITEFFFF